MPPGRPCAMRRLCTHATRSMAWMMGGASGFGMPHMTADRAPPKRCLYGMHALPVPPPPVCGALPAWEGRQGAEAATVSAGATAPLPRSKSDVPRPLGLAARRIPSTKGGHVLHPEVPAGVVTEP